jgi:long-chain fatty acid transport protein
MKKLLKLFTLLFTTAVIAQSGHIMQGVGAVNMSMGGASTAQPLDISGALQWNPAAISTFKDKIFNFDLGLFFSSPELSSSYGPMSGVTQDDRGVSPMPAIAMVWGKEDSKHTFGVSAFGVSGFGVTFPENMSNPISMPQPNGFGHVESDYMLLQIGLTWAYELSENFSVGIEPTINYGALELAPNPLAMPDFPVNLGGGGKGYPVSDKATAIGIGAQIGLFYHSESGIKLGASYKTEQDFSDYEFKNNFLNNGGPAQDVAFKMNYPAILSLGFGYSNEKFDFALDYRMVDYENTDGFELKGWKIAEGGPMNGLPTGQVNGFGWKNIDIVSVGFQYKGIEKLPLRVGYTYSSNPIDEELAFFSIPATAIIKNAFQFGFSHPLNERLTLTGVYHYGDSGGKTEGPMLNALPAMDLNGDGNPEGPWDATNNPLGKVPGGHVSYEMTTSMIMFGISYTFDRK